MYPSPIPKFTDEELCFPRVSQFSSVTQLCPTLCDPVNRSTPGLPVHHQLPEFIQTHIHQVSDAMDMGNLGKLWEIVRDREAWGAEVHGGHKELDMTG